MSDNIVDLRDLFPEKITFVFPGDEEYSLPGDIDNDTVFELYLLLLDVIQLDEKYGELQPTDPNVRRGFAETKKVYDRLEGILLGLFKIHHPDLERLPFNRQGLAVVTQHVLKQIGFLTDEDEPAEQPEGEADRPFGSSTTGSGRSSKSSGSRSRSGGRSATAKRSRGTGSAGAGSSRG